jgi:LysR family transcriptional activator of nhaA
MDWLNYHHLLNFWLVAREGSVQAASEVLHVTPASVSIQVGKLEKALQVKLLKKQGRGVALTEMGQQIAEYAEDIFSTGQELMEIVRGRPVGRSLLLRVGVTAVMPKMLAFELLRPALELEEPVKLICVEGEMSDLVSSLAIHKLDVVLSDSPLDPLYKFQVHSTRLGESDVVIVGSSQLARKYRKNFPQSLNGAPFLMQTPQSVLRRRMDQWFTDKQITPVIKAEFLDSAMLKIAGRRGLGLFAIASVVEDEIKKAYGISRVGVVDGVTEQYFATSAVRKITHSGVLAIREHAHELGTS